MIAKSFKTQEGKVVDLTRCYSQYLSVGLSSEYNIPIVLWLDYNEKKQKEVLVHTFNIIGQQIFIDGNGFFGNIQERLSLYQHNHVNLEVYNLEKARLKLKELGVSYTDAEVKKVVREKLRTQWIAMDIEIGGVVRPIVYWSEGNFMGRDVVFFFQIGNNGLISKLIHKVPVEQFKSARKGNIRFIDRKEYIGLTTNEILRKL